jgi:hypothetical protein
MTRKSSKKPSRASKKTLKTHQIHQQSSLQMNKKVVQRIQISKLAAKTAQEMERKTQNKMEVKKPHKRKAGGVIKAYSLIIIRVCQTVTNIKIHKQIKDTKNHTCILLTSHFFPPGFTTTIQHS